jgi:protein TonB
MPAFVAAIGGGVAGAAQQLPRGPTERPLPAPATTRAANTASVEKSPAIAAKPEPAPIEALPVVNLSESVQAAQPPRVERPAIGADATHDTQIAANGSGGDAQGAGEGGPGAAGAGGGPGIGMSAGPYRLGNGIEPPRRIRDVPPVYPSEAMASRVLGQVLVEAIVGTDGKVHAAKVVRSIPLLDQAALDAVCQWEFVPSKLNGVPIAVIVTVLVQFSLY